MAKNALMNQDKPDIKVISSLSSPTSLFSTPSYEKVTSEATVVGDFDTISSTSSPTQSKSRESRPGLVIPRPAVKGIPSRTCWFLMPALFAETVSRPPSESHPSQSIVTSEDDTRDAFEEMIQEEDDDDEEGVHRQEIIEYPITGDQIRHAVSGQMNIFSNLSSSSKSSSPALLSGSNFNSKNNKRHKRDSNPQFNVKTLISTFKSIQSGNFSGGLLQPLMVSFLCFSDDENEEDFYMPSIISTRNHFLLLSH